MKIGIDLDEVVVDFIGGFLSFYNQKYNKSFLPTEFKTYKLWEAGIGKNKQESIDLVHEFCESDDFDKINFVNGAKESIFEINKLGKIYIITSRHRRFEEKTRRFLENHFPFYLPTYFSSDFHGGIEQTKAGFISSLGINYLIDDSLDYAKDSSQFCKKVFLFDQPWNQRNINGNIIRVKNWNEILELLKNEVKSENAN